MTADLRRAVTGLLSFAAAEEQALLAADAFGPGSGGGSPDRWAAVPLVAPAAAGSARNWPMAPGRSATMTCSIRRAIPG